MDIKLQWMKSITSKEALVHYDPAADIMYIVLSHGNPDKNINVCENVQIFFDMEQKEVVAITIQKLEKTVLRKLK